MAGGECVENADRVNPFQRGRTANFVDASAGARPGTFIVTPLTTGSHPYPFRVACRFSGKDGHIVLDEVRTVDRERLGKRLGVLTATTQAKILVVLQAMFAP